MVLCGYPDQIQLLSALKSFEVDMSYKRIRAKDLNEVLFATFLTDQCKSKYFPATCQELGKWLLTSWSSYYLATGLY
jgi:hypothetical protein